jgi:hypothetical protein
MMDHVEDKPRDIFWEMNQRNIVQYLLKTSNLSERFSDAEINHVVGALEVGANLEQLANHCSNGRESTVNRALDGSIYPG